MYYRNTTTSPPTTCSNKTHHCLHQPDSQKHSSVRQARSTPGCFHFFCFPGGQGLSSKYCSIIRQSLLKMPWPSRKNRSPHEQQPNLFSRGRNQATLLYVHPSTDRRRGRTEMFSGCTPSLPLHSLDRLTTVETCEAITAVHDASPQSPPRCSGTQPAATRQSPMPSPTPSRCAGLPV